MEGYIRIYRQMLEWEWYKDPNTFSVFFHCLLKANYKEGRFMGHDVPAGSFITSISTLAQELNISPHQVRTSLEHLKSTKELTIKTTNRFTVINIENWAKYQSNDDTNGKQNGKQMANKWQTDGKQVATIEESNKEIIKEEVLKESGATDPTPPQPPIVVTSKRKPKAFIPPTLDEVKAYALTKQSPVDTDFFYNYFNEAKWIDSQGNPVLNWKQKFLTWDKKEKEKINGGKTQKPTVLTKSYGDHY